jgi:thiol:disulfide interchange protein
MPGFALYEDKLKVTVEGAELGRVRLPAGEVINDPELGPEKILTGHVTIPIAVRVDPRHAAPTLVVKYQGCQVDQMCYPPQTVRFDLGQ